MRILVCMRQIGGANAVIPVAKELAKRGHDIIFYSQGVAFQRFKEELTLISADTVNPHVLLEMLGPSFAPSDYRVPDIVITETISPEENTVIPRQITKIAIASSIPVVALQDFWASGLSAKWETLPSMVCVQDEWAKKLILGVWPGINEQDVVITGQPAFDDLRSVDCQDARKKLKEMYDLKEDWPIVHYSGGFKGTAESISCLVNALNQLRKPVYLFIRFHPRMTDSNASAEWKKEYARYQELNPELLYGESVETSDRKISDLINAASDIVVGAFPTMIVQACYLRKACLSITNPSAQEYYEMETAGTLRVFPPVALGCCYAAIDVVGSMDALSKIFKGQTLKVEQEKHFVSDGQSANRVADVILGLLRR